MLARESTAAITPPSHTNATVVVPWLSCNGSAPGAATEYGSPPDLAPCWEVIVRAKRESSGMPRKRLGVGSTDGVEAKGIGEAEAMVVVVVVVCGRNGSRDAESSISTHGDEKLSLIHI